MLSVLVFLPVVVALALAALPATSTPRRYTVPWVVTGLVQLVLVAVMWLQLPTSGYGFVEQVAWIPSAGISYHLGVDGLSLPLVAMTVVVFTAAAIYSLREDRRPKSYVLLFLALQTVSVGVFVALDLILFFLFFDLSIVFMYFVIAGWGHGSRARSAALTFFLYTFLGSLALLLGFILLYLAATPAHLRHPGARRPQPARGRRPTGRGRAARHRCRARGEDPARAVPHLVAAGPHRGPGRRLGRAGRGTAQDGDLRVRPHRDAAAAGVVAAVRRCGRGARRGLGHLRRAGRARPDRPQADDRLHLGEPHGLRPARRRRRRAWSPKPMRRLGSSPPPAR